MKTTTGQCALHTVVSQSGTVLSYISVIQRSPLNSSEGNLKLFCLADATDGTSAVLGLFGVFEVSLLLLLLLLFHFPEYLEIHVSCYYVNVQPLPTTNNFCTNLLSQISGICFGGIGYRPKYA